MLRIVYYPDPVLRRKAEAVAADYEGLRELVAGMLEAMVNAQGIGLAAPQVGASLRLFVASASGDPTEALICINPRVQPHGEIVDMEEGCLSIPDFRADIARPEKVRMIWTGLDGSEYEGDFEGLWARVIQHEFDHLEGVLFIDKMTPTDTVRAKPDLKALEEQYRPQ